MKYLENWYILNYKINITFINIFTNYRKEIKHEKNFKRMLLQFKRISHGDKKISEDQKRIKTESPLIMATSKEEMEKRLAENPELLRKAMLTKFKR